uniref:Integrase catalytic domain-containing protein n=1 Tax=Sphaeramia orbicularis TaxID=375764 RepID=A0A672YIK4_9TELE
VWNVKSWVSECVDCASQKSSGRQPCAPLQPSSNSWPFEWVALDILGPLPVTPSGNRYILVIGDYFSKWTEAFPLPNQEAGTIARVLTEEWVFPYITISSPYHPQSDGLIEHFNRTLLSMLSLFVEDNQLNWDTLSPYVMLAYRSSIRASTSFTLYWVLFGREAMLPVYVMLNVGNQEPFTSVDDYVSKLQDTLSSVVIERVTDVLYGLVPVEGGPESVINFNRLKPFASPLPVHSQQVLGPRQRVQTNGEPRPPRGQRPEVLLGARWIHHC